MLIKKIFELSLFVLTLQSIICFETKFYLFTRKNVDKYVEIDFDSPKTLIDIGKSTFFVVHGFDSNPLKKNFLFIKDGILKLNDANVVMVDWSNGADQGINYLKAQSNVKPAGIDISDFIKYFDINTLNIHCIGHSLGAHVCGFVGKVKQLKRISGLDPAGPLFSTAPPQERLDKNDAMFVDNIHTSVGLGISKPIGHKDFFVNGGKFQPGCIMGDLRCYHLRSIDIFGESITSNCSFTSIPCDSYENFSNGKCECDPNIGCSSMGYRADLVKEEGSFFLKTNPRIPFCIN